MRIAENVEMLQLPGNSGPIYPVLLWDEQEAVLVDSGLPGQLELLRAAVASAGFALEEINTLILTHQDIDHIGCAAELAKLGLTVLAHEEEAPYIEGRQPLIKLAELEARLPQLSEEQRIFYERLKVGASQCCVKVDRLLRDGDTMSYCGGLQVIHTPGHTPGHIALLLQKSNIVLCGDAANITDGAWCGANPRYTNDMAQAESSLQKLRALQPAAAVCYHGGLLQLQ